MPEKKTDRRIRYTLMVIQNSLIELLKEKPMTKITVKEICELADINRATFYSHYNDQYQLLHSIEQQIIEEVKQYLFFDRSDALEIESNSLKMLTGIMEYIRQNADICTTLLSTNSNLDFQHHILEVVHEQLISEWHAKEDISKEDAEYIFTYISSGCVGVIKQWLATGMTKTSQEAADLLWKLSYFPALLE